MVDGTSINVTSHCDIAVATPLSPQAARIRTNKANRFTFLSPFLKVIEHSVTVPRGWRGAGHLSHSLASLWDHPHDVPVLVNHKNRYPHNVVAEINLVPRWRGGSWARDR